MSRQPVSIQPTRDGSAGQRREIALECDMDSRFTAGKTIDTSYLTFRLRMSEAAKARMRSFLHLRDSDGDETPSVAEIGRRFSQ
jgi:hypothetical protein